MDFLPTPYIYPSPWHPVVGGIHPISPIAGWQEKSRLELRCEAIDLKERECESLRRQIFMDMM